MIKLPYPWGKKCLPNISDFQCSILSFLSWITSKMAVLSFDLLFYKTVFLVKTCFKSWFWRLTFRVLFSSSFERKKDIFQTSAIRNSTDICYSFFRLVCTNFLFMLETILYNTNNLITYLGTYLVRRRSLIMLTKFWTLLTYLMLTLRWWRIFFTVVKKNLHLCPVRDIKNWIVQFFNSKCCKMPLKKNVFLKK